MAAIIKHTHIASKTTWWRTKFNEIRYTLNENCGEIHNKCARIVMCPILSSSMSLLLMSLAPNTPLEYIPGANGFIWWMINRNAPTKHHQLSYSCLIVYFLVYSFLVGIFINGRWSLAAWDVHHLSPLAPDFISSKCSDGNRILFWWRNSCALILPRMYWDCKDA